MIWTIYVKIRCTVSQHFFQIPNISFCRGLKRRAFLIKTS